MPEVLRNSLPEAIGAIIATVAIFTWHQLYSRARRRRRQPILTEFLERTEQKLRNIDALDNPYFNQFLQQEMARIYTALEQYSNGLIEYRGEAWRHPWRELLNLDAVTFYYSVALIKSPSYWQDATGKSAIEFNNQLALRKRVERIFVIWESVWDDEGVRHWISAQRSAGIKVFVLRRSEIHQADDVLYDLGIYGNVAVGYQYFDSDCITQKFDFNFHRDMYILTMRRYQDLQSHVSQELTDAYLDRLVQGAPNPGPQPDGTAGAVPRG